MVDVVSRSQPIAWPVWPPPQLPELARLTWAEEVDTVYLTIGGNDLGFAAKLLSCRFGKKACLRDREALGRELAAERANLAKVYRAVRGVSRARRLVVVGYPEIVPDGGETATGCRWLRVDEQANAADFSGRLDRMLAGAAAEGGAEYVSILGALDGHELCTPGSWMYPILQLGKPVLTTQHGHPRAAGQRAIAAAVAAELEARDTLEGAFGLPGTGPELVDRLGG